MGLFQVTTEDPASQTLLLYDDEAKMLEWFLRLQMKIKEVVCQHFRLLWSADNLCKQLDPDQDQHSVV